MIIDISQLPSSVAFIVLAIGLLLVGIERILRRLGERFEWDDETFEKWGKWYFRIAIVLWIVLVHIALWVVEEYVGIDPWKW